MMYVNIALSNKSAQLVGRDSVLCAPRSLGMTQHNGNEVDETAVLYENWCVDAVCGSGLGVLCTH